MGSGCSVKDVVELIKVRQTLFLVIAMYLGLVFAGSTNPYTYLIAGIVAFTSIAATTSINMVFDADIDAVMTRTRDRPLPRGVCDARKVLSVSLLALVASIIAAFILVNAYFALFVAIGAFADIVLYTLYSKRRTWLSIFLGAVAGASPVLGGYAAVKGYIDIEAVLLSMLIVSWIPAHIWTLAMHYRDDYARAHIPMLPVVRSVATARKSIITSVVVFLTTLIALYMLGAVSLPAIVLTAVLGAAVLVTVRSCKPGACITSFKLVNIMLGLCLASCIASRLIVPVATPLH